MIDTNKLAAELAADFAQLRSQGSQAQQEANTLIAIVLEADPKIKLPKLLADERVKEWQKEKGVKVSHLKCALVEGRAARKQQVATDEIRVPTRTRRGSRKRIEAETSSEVASIGLAAPSLPGLVPNLSLDHL